MLQPPMSEWLHYQRVFAHAELLAYGYVLFVCGVMAGILLGDLVRWLRVPR